MAADHTEAAEQVAVHSIHASADQDGAQITINDRAYSLTHAQFLALRAELDAQAIRFVH